MATESSTQRPVGAKQVSYTIPSDANHQDDLERGPDYATPSTTRDVIEKPRMASHQNGTRVKRPGVFARTFTQQFQAAGHEDDDLDDHGSGGRFRLTESKLKNRKSLTIHDIGTLFDMTETG